MAPFEIILVIAGVVLFIVLIGMLINGSGAKAIVPLFLIVVIMIGYHSIKKITYKDGSITIEKFANDVIADPHDEARAQEFTNALDQPTASSELTNSQTRAQAVHALCVLADAKTTTKDFTAAQVYVNKAKSLDPSSYEVQTAQDFIIMSRASNDEFNKENAKAERELEQFKKKHGLQ